MVHVHVLQDAGHCQRMRYVGFAAAADLAIMGLGRVVKCAPDQVDLGRLEISGKFAGQCVYGVHGVSSGTRMTSGGLFLFVSSRLTFLGFFVFIVGFVGIIGLMLLVCQF